LIERQLTAGEVGELFVLRLGVAIQSRHRLDELFSRQPATVPVRNGSTSGDQPDTRQRILRRRNGRQPAGRYRRC
jgi:hypothetical protein